MSTSQILQQKIAALPEAAQQELAGFVGTLTSKYADVEREHRAWSDFSLASAMRGMENEESIYSVSDLKEHW